MRAVLMVLLVGLAAASSPPHDYAKDPRFAVEDSLTKSSSNLGGTPLQYGLVLLLPRCIEQPQRVSNKRPYQVRSVPVKYAAILNCQRLIGAGTRFAVLQARPFPRRRFVRQ
jgi:hypothetical protein